MTNQDELAYPHCRLSNWIRKRNLPIKSPANELNIRKRLDCILYHAIQCIAWSMFQIWHRFFRILSEYGYLHFA